MKTIAIRTAKAIQAAQNAKKCLDKAQEHFARIVR